MPRRTGSACGDPIPPRLTAKSGFSSLLLALALAGCGGGDDDSEVPPVSAQDLQTCIDAQGLRATSFGSSDSAAPLAELEEGADTFFSTVTSPAGLDSGVGSTSGAGGGASLSGIDFYIYPDASAAEQAASSADTTPSDEQGGFAWLHQVENENNVVWVYEFAGKVGGTLTPSPEISGAVEGCITSSS